MMWLQLLRITKACQYWWLTAALSPSLFTNKSHLTRLSVEEWAIYETTISVIKLYILSYTPQTGRPLVCPALYH